MSRFALLSKFVRPVWTYITAPFDFSDYRFRRLTYLYLIVTWLHGVLDPAISYIGIEIFALGWEANPLMRLPMQSGPVMFLLVHIPLYLVLLLAYVMMIELLNRELQNGTDTVYHLAFGGLILLSVWGVWLNIRNLLILVSGTG